MTTSLNLLIIEDSGDDALLRMREILFMCLVLFFTCTLLSPEVAEAAPRTVRAGIYNYKPLVYAEKGVAKGFFVDILDHIAAKEDWQLQYQTGTWQEGVESLKNGQLDLILCVGFSEGRDKYMDFPKEFLLLDWGLVYKPKGSAINTIMDLKGKKISVLKGSIYSEGFMEIARKFEINVTILEMNEVKDVFSSVANGQADAGVTANIAGILNESGYQVERTPIIFTPVKLGYATGEGKNSDITAAIDRRIAELKADPDSLYHRKYHELMAGGNASIPKKFILLLGIIAALLGLSVLFIIVLRREVGRKTRTLQESAEQYKTLNNQLEERIQERTADLQTSNQSLRKINAEVLRITEEIRESRQQLLDIIDFFPDATFVINNDKQVIVWNSAMEKMSGINKSEMLGQGDYAYTIPFYGERRRSLLDLLDEENEDLKAKYQNEMKENNILTAETFCPALNGGKGAYVWAAAAKLFNIKGERVGTIESIRDITNRRHAQDALTRANQEMESFAYSVSHDLRAPLRSIDGFSLALLEDCGDKLDDEGKDYLRRVRAATQKMAQLIDDILKLSRITRAELASETVNLSAIAVSIAEELRRDDQQRKVEFVIKDDIITKGDPRLLTLVLENLLGNAWKFTSGHVEARIEFGISDIDGKTAYFVRDDGAGFDMKYVDKLFTTFQRLHSELEFPGTGVGLTLVQHIIHRHGGTIWAEGAVDQGATFWFTVG